VTVGIDLIPCVEIGMNANPKIEEDREGRLVEGVFIDRDGVINEEVDLLTEPDQIRLIPGSAEAIARLNRRGLPAIVVTNQPAVARGWITEAQIEEIHESLAEKLWTAGRARLDEILACPHHHEADMDVYRMSCACRKPKPGLLIEGARRRGLDLTKCFMIGDMLSDIDAGARAGCRTILVRTGYGGERSVGDTDPDVRPDYTCDNLGQAVEVILGFATPPNALILAAGLGTRMREVDPTTPKVLLPFRGRPILEHQILYLKRFGIDEFFINLHHRAETIAACLNDGASRGVRIRYAFEEELRGTSGALHGFRDRVRKTLLVLYGDVINTLKMDDLIAFHHAKRAWATLVVRRSDHPKDSDIVMVDDAHRVTEVLKKPGLDRPGLLGNAGIYLLEPEVLDYLPPGNSDFVADLFPRLLKDGRPLYAYYTEDYICDIGTPDRYRKAEKIYPGY